MASSVRPQPNYYEVLGLSPAATQEDIGRAFARGMGMFGAHAVGTAAAISAAFETLRNPAKRRAYDEAIGVPREPEPQVQRQQWSLTIPAQTTRGFVASAPGPAEKAGSDTLARLARLAEPQPLVAARPEARPEPAAPPPTANRGVGSAAPKAPPPPAAARRQPQLLSDEDIRPLEWKRPALTFAGLLVAAGLIGAVAGSSLLQPQQAQKSAGAGRLYGRPVGKEAAPATAAAATPQVSAQAPAAQAVYAPAAARRVQRSRPPHHSAFAAETAQVLEPADAAATTQDPVADASPAAAATSDTDVAPSPAVETIAAAGLPIAAGVMARTIERIGYSCGSVASATPIGGAGAYKVTCTSGDSYRAAPVRGRYHFKRLSRR